MLLNFNATGADRKRMVKAIEEELGITAKYLGAPTMAYEVGGFRVNRDGSLEYGEMPEERADCPQRVINAIEAAGFAAEEADTADAGEGVSEGEATTETEGTGLSIELPRAFFTDESLENLKKIVESKAALIKKAIGADELPITVTDEKVIFAWFTAQGADEAKAYGNLIAKMSQMAKDAKRVVAKEKTVESEKFAFRCFLLRLGFKGNEYKYDRKILLRNLDGPAAFPTREAAEKFESRRKEMKEEQA